MPARALAGLNAAFGGLSYTKPKMVCRLPGFPAQKIEDEKEAGLPLVP
jgi:hypothetical protein